MGGPWPERHRPRRGALGRYTAVQKTSTIAVKRSIDLRSTVRDVNRVPEAEHEWLVANGLGGYASATVTGAITRRYHGLLIAAHPAPLGRMVVLDDLEVDIERADGS